MTPQIGDSVHIAIASNGNGEIKQAAETGSTVAQVYDDPRYVKVATGDIWRVIRNHLGGAKWRAVG